MAKTLRIQLCALSHRLGRFINMNLISFAVYINFKIMVIESSNDRSRYRKCSVKEGVLNLNIIQCEDFSTPFKFEALSQYKSSRSTSFSLSFNDPHNKFFLPTLLLLVQTFDTILTFYAETADYLFHGNLVIPITQLITPNSPSKRSL